MTLVWHGFGPSTYFTLDSIYKDVETKLKLNPTKFYFTVRLRVLLGHIVSKKGLTINPQKVKEIYNHN